LFRSQGKKEEEEEEEEELDNGIYFWVKVIFLCLNTRMIVQKKIYFDFAKSRAMHGFNDVYLDKISIILNEGISVIFSMCIITQLFN
jgi:hypothetical protein